MLNEIKVALRGLLKSPGFTIIAVATLALAIGANSAVFSLINALLVRPLPYRNPEKVVLMLEHFKNQHLDAIPMSAPEFVDYQTQTRVFDKIAVFQTTTFNIAGGDMPERIFGAQGTSDLFAVLGISALKGRTFLPEECKNGRDDVLVISERLWKRRFNGEPQVIGSKLLANGRTFTIIGIMPENFEFPIPLFNIEGARFGERVEIWQPRAFTDAEMKIRYSRGYAAVARLASNVSVKQAQSDVDRVAGVMRQQYPDNYPHDESFGATVFPLPEQVVGGMRPLLLLLLGAVTFVLLIACANLTTMSLVRAASREREMAIRVALGAGPWRLLRQVLTESVLLSILGAIVGVLLAIWGIDFLKTIGAQTVPRLAEVDVDWRVLAMTLGIAVGTGILFGLAPALAGTKQDLTESLKEGGRGSTAGSHRNRLRNILVVIEVALALVLLSNAVLLMKSFFRLQNVDPGFKPPDVLTMEFSLPVLRYPDNRSQIALFTEVERRVSALPGVQYAAFTSLLPMSGSNSDSSFNIEGRSTNDKNPAPDEEIRLVSSDYFRVLQTPLLQGRFFTQSDTADAPPVVIINRALAQRYWPNENPLGKQISVSSSDPKEKWCTIVGTVGDIRHRGLDVEARPEYYIPIAQTFGQVSVSNNNPLVLAVRSTRDLHTLAAAIRREIRLIDETQPIAHVRTLEQVISDSVAPRRLSVVLLGMFAGIALLLASVGIYGVMSFLVVQRTHEIGVRMALGAQRRDVFRLVLIHAGRLVGTGTAIGLLGTFLSAFGLRSLLYQLSGFDLSTFGFVTLVLVLVALVASYLPALRATKADPMIALSHNA
jgi:putative ABC transport system permease protein